MSPAPAAALPIAAARDGVARYLRTVPAKYRSTVPYYVPPILPRARSLSSVSELVSPFLMLLLQLYQ